MAKEGFDLVIGLGVSGRSVIRYLTDQGMPVRALDTRAEPAGLDALRADFPEVKIHTGGFKAGWMKKARRLIVSPGVAVSTPAIAEQVVPDADKLVKDMEAALVTSGCAAALAVVALVLTGDMAFAAYGPWKIILIVLALGIWAGGMWFGASLATRKGYSPWLGVVLHGLLGLIGTVILLVMRPRVTE
mgnify:CR=1 FL=1